MSKHTPDLPTIIIDDSPEIDTKRLIASWVACKSIPTEALEAGVIQDLLEAAKAVVDDAGTRFEPLAALQLVIDKAEGGE